ncbi:MAG: IS3 family transposase [Acidimicrobiales bacterium]
MPGSLAGSFVLLGLSTVAVNGTTGETCVGVPQVVQVVPPAGADSTVSTIGNAARETCHILGTPRPSPRRGSWARPGAPRRTVKTAPECRVRLPPPSSNQRLHECDYDAKSRPASPRALRDAQLGPALVELWKHNYSVYGRRKLHKAAHRAGIDAGRDQVARLMATQGIQGATRAIKRFTTRPDASHVRAPDLVKRNLAAVRPDALWVADFTYCSTWSGIVYVAFIIDVFSRRLVGWKAARSMTVPLVLDALNMAAWTRRNTSLDALTCHTDAGSQYTSIAYTEALGDIGGAPSIGTVGDSLFTG